jgi:D-alanyl-D-alanine dipeptidase
MGSIIDDTSSAHQFDYFEIMALNNPESMSQSHTEAFKNRMFLYHAMTKHGFSNYNPEWWYYD